MPVAVCTDYLSQQLHIPVSRPLEFYPGRQGTRELPLVWRGMIHHLSDQLRLGPSIIGNRRVQKQYGMLLAEVLLGHYCNSYSEQIALHGNDISPRHVRRAREIIWLPSMPWSMRWCQGWIWSTTTAAAQAPG